MISDQEQLLKSQHLAVSNDLQPRKAKRPEVESSSGYLDRRVYIQLGKRLESNWFDGSKRSNGSTV